MCACKNVHGHLSLINLFLHEQCDTPYHLTCLSPPLGEVPEGEWFCEACTASPGAPIGEIPKPTYSKNASPKTKKNKKRDENESGEAGEGSELYNDAETDVGQKRKGMAGSQKSGSQSSIIVSIAELTLIK